MSDPLDSLKPGETTNKADRKKINTLTCTADSAIVEQIDRIAHATHKQRKDVVIILIEAGLNAWLAKFKDTKLEGPLPVPPGMSSPAPTPSEVLAAERTFSDPPVLRHQPFDGATGAFASSPPAERTG